MKIESRSRPNADGGDKVQSLHEYLIGSLRALIVQGELLPESRVPEVSLCERFGVSRTPLREALKVLASEGLVEILPNRGSRITKTSISDLHELFQVMSALEDLAGELAAARITDDEIAHVRDLHEKMVLAFSQNDRPAYFELNQAIHDAILAASGNAALRTAHRAIAGRILASRYQANLSPVRWATAVKEHEALLRLLELRRGPELGRMLRVHILNKFESIQHNLPTETAAPEKTKTRRNRSP